MVLCIRPAKGRVRWTSNRVAEDLSWPCLSIASSLLRLIDQVVKEAEKS